MSYQDFANTTKFLTPGTISIEAIRKAQKADSFTLNLLKNKSNKFVKIDDVLFHSSPNRNENRLVLPNNLLDALIVSKHITVFGLHHSKTRMRREIASRYFVDMRTLNLKLNAITKSCIQCQFNSSSPKQHILKQTNFVYALSLIHI